MLQFFALKVAVTELAELALVKVKDVPDEGVTEPLPDTAALTVLFAETGKARVSPGTILRKTAASLVDCRHKSLCPFPRKIP